MRFHHLAQPVKSRLQLLIGLLLLGSLVLMPADRALAGIYNADQEVAYREYWVPHTAANFSGGFKAVAGNDSLAEAGCPAIYNYGWFLEPWPVVDVNGQPCAKTVEFSIPDSLEGALRAEIYLDLWRNHASPQVRFTLNGGERRAPNLGDDWSRNGYVGDIPLSELRQGANTMIVESAGSGLHIHDIAIRIYYDAAAIGAPAGSLKSVNAGGATVSPPANGGVLDVNANQVTLTANVTSANVKFVEFHAYYEGYDEDNNRVFRDWHNRGRHDWHPGGRFEEATGGTIDHVGTVAVGGPGDYSITWNMAHIHNQAGVKFKIRLVSAMPGNDNAYIVRDAAGGASGDFTLKRNRAVMTFYNPGFFDNVLCHRDANDRNDCRFDEEWSTLLDIPVDVAQFNQAFFLGAYWDNPFVKINDGSEFAGSAGFDWWALGVQPRPISEFRTGANTIRYRYNSGANYFGQFVEKPGPMIVLGQTSAVADTVAPQLFDNSPFSGQGGVAVDSAIRIVLSEIRNQIGHGIDIDSIELKINGATVTPTISGFANEYTLRYQPLQPFAPNSTVTVEVDACDLAGNCLAESYQFFTQGDDAPFDAVSDDFNVCVLDESLWTWRNPRGGDASYQIIDNQLEISVPGGTSHDVWAGANHAPRLLQPVTNAANFEIVTKFDSVPTLATQMQGILLEEDDDTLLRVDFEYRSSGGTPGIYLFAAGLDGGTAGEKATVYVGDYDEGPIYLRVRRINTTQWQIGYSAGGEEWIDAALFSHNITVNSTGVFAGNAIGNPAFTMAVDYFFNMADPIEPEDDKVLRFEELDLAVLPSEGGSVIGGSSCGSPLTLTATPVNGWRFGGWEVVGPNAAETMDNPLTRAFSSSNTVSARFERDGFAVDVDVINNGTGPGGSVTFTPDRTVFYLDESVTLTAVTPPGWTFDGWGGDLSGTDPVQEITVTGDVTATATFTQQQYALTVNVTGSGSGVVMVDGTPVTSPPEVFNELFYGKEVTLSAAAALDGSRFAGWSGDLPVGVDPFAPTLTLTIQDNTAITATFLPAESFGLVVTVEPGSAAGSVTVTPQRAEYQAGDVVEVRAVAQPGWLFAGWSGALNGTVNPATLEITGDTQVIARFTEQSEPSTDGNVYLPIITRPQPGQ